MLTNTHTHTCAPRSLTIYVIPLFGFTLNDQIDDNGADIKLRGKGKESREEKEDEEEPVAVEEVVVAVYMQPRLAIY